METSFKDRFSFASSAYCRYRPAYPGTLFAYLASLTTHHDVAWDCATGNGQCAVALAGHYKRVFATDASRKQLSRAIETRNVSYSVSDAQHSGLHGRSVDIVTVAQALHWFAGEAFYGEVRRVLKPDGVIAAWIYHLPTVTPAVDRIVHRLYHDVFGDFWEPEIRHIETGYRKLPFPFENIAVPAFGMTANWTLAELRGYIRTWSATAARKERFKTDIPEDTLSDLSDAWGNDRSKRRIEWPLVLRAGRVA